MRNGPQFKLTYRSLESEFVFHKQDLKLNRLSCLFRTGILRRKSDGEFGASARAITLDPESSPERARQGICDREAEADATVAGMDGRISLLER